MSNFRVEHCVYTIIFCLAFRSRANYETTGPEIWRDMDGQIDAFVAGAGLGGTFSGVARYLKEKNPKIRAILADPVGSTMGGGEHADYNIEGIGNDFIPDTMDISLVDEVVKVTDETLGWTPFLTSIFSPKTSNIGNYRLSNVGTVPTTAHAVIPASLALRLMH